MSRQKLCSLLGVISLVSSFLFVYAQALSSSDNTFPTKPERIVSNGHLNQMYNQSHNEELLKQLLSPTFSKRYNDQSNIDVSTNFGTQRPAKILSFPPIVFESHLFILKKLAKGLKKRGHHLSIFVSDRRSIEENSTVFSVRRFPGLFSTEEAAVFLQQKVSNILAGKPTFLELLDILQHYSQNCDIIFSKGRKSIEQLRKEEYDMMIIDPNEMCGFLLAKELGLPYVVLSTGMWVPYEAYVPSPIAYVPEFNSLLSDRMNFFQRFKNACIYGVSRFGTSYLIFPIYNRLISKYSIGTEKVSQLIKGTKSWLLCTDTALEFPRPLMPNVEYIGGILGDRSKALPENLQEWADDSSKNGGFIIVSFGAGVHHLNSKLEQIFVKVLSKLPYRVIWRYGSPLKDLNSNIKLVDWLPQNDLLAHSNVRAFVGHGGTNGVYECLYHSVPIVGIPLFGDHYDSMARVQAKGIGLRLNWKHLSDIVLLEAITEVISNPKYRMNMRRFSQIHHDQPMTSLERAVHRIDYTIRYYGADHLRSHVLNLSFVQYFLLDIQLTVVVVVLLVIWILQKLFMMRSLTWDVSKGIEFLPLTNGSNPSLDNYQSPSSAASLRVSGYRFPQTGKEGSIGCIGTYCCIPKFLYNTIGSSLLWICTQLRLLAVHIANQCETLRRSSRIFVKCLDVLTGALRCVFPSSSNNHAKLESFHELERVIPNANTDSVRDSTISSRVNEMWSLGNSNNDSIGLTNTDNRTILQTSPASVR